MARQTQTPQSIQLSCVGPGMRDRVAWGLVMMVFWRARWRQARRAVPRPS